MELDLYSERLHLRPLVEDDLDLALEILTDYNVMQYAGGVSNAEDIIAEMPVVTRRGGGGCIGVWCVTDKVTGEKLGTSNLLPMPIEEPDTNWDMVVTDNVLDEEIEIGYLLKPTAWGNGYATETASRLLQFAFEDTILNEVVACFDEENEASHSVLEKIGMTFESKRLAYGEILPVYRILKQQWLGKQRFV